MDGVIDGLGLPTRESEALEWFEAAVMLLVKDGVDVLLTGRRGAGVQSYRHADTCEVVRPQRIVGDLDGTVWRAECTFDVPRYTEVTGFEARTPEGAMVGRGRVAAERFDDFPGTYRLTVTLEWRLFPL